MIHKISHIGIAVENLDAQIAFYRDILQLPFCGTEEVPDQHVKVAMFQAGEVRIELLEATSAESPIAKFITKRGQGMHHIAYQVDDIKQQIHFLQDNSVRMIDSQPRQGAEGAQIAFIHPMSTFGVLTELCEERSEIR